MRNYLLWRVAGRIGIFSLEKRILKKSTIALFKNMKRYTQKVNGKYSMKCQKKSLLIAKVLPLWIYLQMKVRQFSVGRVNMDSYSEQWIAPGCKSGCFQELSSQHATSLWCFISMHVHTFVIMNRRIAGHTIRCDLLNHTMKRYKLSL